MTEPTATILRIVALTARVLAVRPGRIQRCLTKATRAARKGLLYCHEPLAFTKLRASEKAHLCKLGFRVNRRSTDYSDTDFLIYWD